MTKRTNQTKQFNLFFLRYRKIFNSASTVSCVEHVPRIFFFTLFLQPVLQFHYASKRKNSLSTPRAYLKEVPNVFFKCSRKNKQFLIRFIKLIKSSGKYWRRSTTYFPYSPHTFHYRDSKCMKQLVHFTNTDTNNQKIRVPYMTQRSKQGNFCSPDFFMHDKTVSKNDRRTQELGVF